MGIGSVIKPPISTGVAGSGKVMGKLPILLLTALSMALARLFLMPVVSILSSTCTCVALAPRYTIGLFKPLVDSARSSLLTIAALSAATLGDTLTRYCCACASVKLLGTSRP